MTRPLDQPRELAEGLLLGFVLLVAGLALSASNVLMRWDLVAYDWLLTRQVPARSDRIVIVAVDEPSLDALGRWPWPRRVHADLLDRLTEAGVSAVGFDVLFAERDRADPEGDRLFAEALARNGRTILAVAPTDGVTAHTIDELLPWPDFARNAAGLGHVDFEVDLDGITRGLYLRAGQGDARWPALGLALRELGEGPLDDLPGERAAAVAGGAAWVRDLRLLIPFSPAGSYPRYSFVDVLEGRLDPGIFRGRIVLVGMTVAGLGESLAAPGAGAHRLLSGVEANANVVNALLSGSGVVVLPWPVRSALVLLLVLTGTLLLVLFPPRLAVPAVALGVALALGSSGLLLHGLRHWLPPVPILVVLIFALPLWSWRWIESASRMLGRLAFRVELQETQDSVTRLPNRGLLLRRIDDAILDARKSGRSVGLLLVSIYRFQQVNIRLGYSAGDQLLRELAQRLQSNLREGDLLASLGGAEFAVLMGRLSDGGPVNYLAARLNHALERPFSVDGDRASLSASMGSSLYPGDADDGVALLLNAYTALRRQKELGRRGHRAFSPDMKTAVLERLGLERDLQEVLERGELEVFYQPQVVAGDGRLVGVEALLRWRHPLRGLVSPAEFIPIAEDTGLIAPIGAWVLEQACRQAEQWSRLGYGRIRVAVNISAGQLARDDLAETVSRVLARTGVPAEYLELELTESVILQDMETALGMLRAIRAMGVRLSIDDFGTGYSSLSYLKNLPIDRIKIDRSFIHDMERGAQDAEIALSIIAMAHRLDLRVVAEGVETAAQMEILRSHRCDELQGFLLGRPCPAAELTARLGELASAGLRITPA